MIAVTTMVWAIPRSLATTCGITVVFFSSGYLDVSVPRVRLHTCMVWIPEPPPWWVVPFGYLRLKAYLQLTVAFRSLSRPSSPLRAKASTICPCLLLMCSLLLIKNIFCCRVFFLSSMSMSVYLKKGHHKTALLKKCYKKGKQKNKNQIP